MGTQSLTQPPPVLTRVWIRGWHRPRTYQMDPIAASYAAVIAFYLGGRVQFVSDTLQADMRPSVAPGGAG